jgi:MraZ protein
VSKAFHGEHRLTIDEKNRILIPSAIRANMDPETRGNAFMLIIGLDRTIWLFPEKTFDLLTSSLPSSLAPDANQLAFERMLFARSHRAEWDKQGRMVLPEKMLQRTGIERDVALLGVRDHLELWPLSKWETEEQQLTDQMGRLSDQFRQAGAGMRSN